MSYVEELLCVFSLFRVFSFFDKSERILVLPPAEEGVVEEVEGELEDFCAETFSSVVGAGAFSSLFWSFFFPVFLPEPPRFVEKYREDAYREDAYREDDNGNSFTNMG